MRVGPPALSGAREGARAHVVHEGGVRTVDEKTRNPVARRAQHQGVAGVLVVRQGLVSVLVVVDDDDEGKLAHGGEVHRLVKIARARAAVADVGEGGLALSAHLRRPGHARGDGHHGADVADELGDALGPVAHMEVAVAPARGTLGAPEEMRHDAAGRMALGEVRAAVSVHGHEPLVVFEAHGTRRARPLVAPAEEGRARNVAGAKGGVERLLDRAGERDEVVHALGRRAFGQNLAFGEGYPARLHAVHGEVSLGEVGEKIEVRQLLARGEGVFRFHERCASFVCEKRRRPRKRLAESSGRIKPYFPAAWVSPLKRAPFCG